ncbi:transposase [Streptosporangium carneum]|uniref:Transposase n=1 Tax=Streptosporangium carneum TaxID=47481 RepID=A0A9W6MIH2_9ACTN|nr:transposase [Streptosporangium carneum]GLK15386.1 hypothetical protein GCM10017600_87990 [Streptosporangium carneum]
MAETRRGFDPEFRAGAVRIVRETGNSIAQVARDLGVNADTLSDWTRADRLAREHETDTELIGSEREELTRARRLRGSSSSTPGLAPPPAARPRRPVRGRAGE